MDTVDQDFIKKSKINYIRCTEGQLHDGEVMNFVCVDAKCAKKGLICPVCRMNQHDQHKIIPLKIFLNEVRNRFLSQTNQSQLTGLSDYLRTLDNTKKQLLSSLRETVVQIAEKVKKVEEKIIENYNNLRRMILTQSTISTKLPGLISLMLDSGDRQPKQLQAQFQKYADLIRYEDNKINFFDSSRKIVEDYSNLPGTITSHLTTLIPQLNKIFDTLPLSIQENKSIKPPVINYTFSDKQKIHQIRLSQNQKEVYIQSEQYQYGGYAIVKEGLGVPHQSIAIKITGNGSGCITVGMANSQILKVKGYKHDEVDPKHGLYTISSMGITFQHNEVDKSEQQAFVFENGDIIQLQWVAKTKKLTFSRRNGVEKYVMDINVTQIESSKLQFVVGLFAESDKAEIVE